MSSISAGTRFHGIRKLEEDVVNSPPAGSGSPQNTLRLIADESSVTTKWRFSPFAVSADLLVM